MSLIQLTRLRFGPRTMKDPTHRRELLKSEHVLISPSEVSRAEPATERDADERPELGARVVMKEIYSKEYVRPVSGYWVKETPDEIWDMVQAQKEADNERR